MLGSNYAPTVIVSMSIFFWLRVAIENYPGPDLYNSRDLIVHICTHGLPNYYLLSTILVVISLSLIISSLLVLLSPSL